jgi:hypothetical protein
VSGTVVYACCLRGIVAGGTSARGEEGVRGGEGEEEGEDEGGGVEVHCVCLLREV